MTNEDDIRFEGRSFVFPEQYAGDLDGLERDVSRYVRVQKEMVIVDRVFDYRPYDGAHAVWNCLKMHFGYAQSKARQGMFGPEPPHEITVPIGYVNGKLGTQTVPWGDMMLPGLRGATLTITSQRTGNGDLLYLSTQCRKIEKPVIDGFYRVVEDYLREHSIYRGHAINGGMEFFDTDLINPELFVYTDDVWAQVETNILSPLKDTEELRRHGMSLKRVVLLEGPYGSGKSGLGRTAAKIAVANGKTAITARPGVDDPFAVLQTARLYQPALIFIEDVDTFSSSQDPMYVTKLLDTFDGFDNKDIEMTLVLTTNHADRIHKGMLRPGRLDAVIHIGEMDRGGVEKLCRLVIGDKLEDGTDFDAVFAATTDFMPAYVKEAIERAIRYTIARTGMAGNINTADLVAACKSLRAQHGMQEAAVDSHEKLPALDAVMRNIIADISGNSIDYDTIVDATANAVYQKMNGARLYKTNGDQLGVIGVVD
jgi:transitional endoplasmic reticulum ATPase